MQRYDVMILGAGMVGISTAIALLARGRSVVLVDRRGPAEETSYGNAGLIQAEAVMPYAFPRSLRAIVGVLTGRRTDARIAWRALGTTAPWLLAYARASAPAAVMRTAEANAPLVKRAVDAHRALAERAGALDLWRTGGYLRIYRDGQSLDRAARADEAVRERFGVPFAVMDRAALAAAEPHLSRALAGAVHLPEPVRIEDPGALGAAYAAHLGREGGAFARADALALRREPAGFSLPSANGGIAAREAVIALGPWSGDLVRRFGHRVPLGVKRGYHRHHSPRGNAVLHRLVVDEANGFVLSPNRRGIRITTGAEFARRDDPPTPRQLARVEPMAQALFPLACPADTGPWLGARPCLPDLLPVIGPVPGEPGLWANFGHHHLGFTLGPVTGRLLAEMLTGAEPFTDPAPYAVDRFASGLRGAYPRG